MLKENILDSRFTGKSIKMKVLGYSDYIEGVVDEVSKYEVGIRAREGAIVVFRHAILLIEVQAPDLHGYRQEELEDTVLTTDFIGSDVEINLINGEKISGKLMKITKYEIGLVTSEGKAFIIPKSSISIVRIKE